MLHVRLDRILQRLCLRPADALDLLFVLPLHLQASARGRTRVSWDAAGGHTGQGSRDAAGGAASALRPSSLGIMRLRKGSSIWAGMARTKWNDGSARTPWLRISLSAAGLLSPITCA